MIKDELVKIIAEQVKPIVLLLEYDRGFAKRVLDWAKTGNINLGDKDGNVDGQTVNRAAQYMALVPRYQKLFGNNDPAKIANTQDGLRVMDYIIEKDPEPIPIPEENKDEWEQIVKAAYGGIPGSPQALVAKAINGVANSLDFEDSSSPQRTAAIFNVMNTDPGVQKALAQDPDNKEVKKAVKAVATVTKSPRKVDNLPAAEKKQALAIAHEKGLKPEDIKALEDTGRKALRSQLGKLSNLVGKGDWDGAAKAQLQAIYIERVFNTIIQIASRGNVSTACKKSNADKEKGKLAPGIQNVQLDKDYIKTAKAKKAQAAAANRKDRDTIEKVVRESLKRLKVKK